MNTLIPYLKYKAAARSVIVYLILFWGIRVANTVLLLSTPALFIFSIIYISIYLYIWATFWKLIVIDLGKIEMNPYFLITFIAIILGIRETLFSLYNIPKWIEFGLFSLTSITYLLFSIKLLSISHDLFNLKKAFAYTYLSVTIIYLSLGIINLFDESGNNIIYTQFFWLFEILPVVLIIGNYIIHFQIFNRAEKVLGLNGKGSIEELIQEIGEGEGK